MKVLFTTNIPSPYRVDFFNELGKFCDLTVVFEAESAKDRDKKWKNNNFVNFKAVFLKGIRVGTDSAFCPEIIKFLNKKKFDVFVIGLYSSPTGMLAIETLKLKNIPFILSSDGGIKKEDSGIKHKIKEHFISSASAWLSTGEVTTEYLTYYGAKKEKVYKYPFTSIFEKDILKTFLSSDEKQICRNKLGIIESNMVLSVGQFIYRKGYDVLLKACADLDADTGVYIVGGEPTDEYIQLKEQLNLNNVHFVNFMKKDELAEYYKAADVFVLPTREDIWGLVVNEAMAFGLPVITTDKCVAGMELVEDGINGYIVASENEMALSAAIKETLLQADKKGVLSLECIRNYTIEKMASVHMNIFMGIKEGKSNE